MPAWNVRALKGFGGTGTRNLCCRCPIRVRRSSSVPYGTSQTSRF